VDRVEGVEVDVLAKEGRCCLQPRGGERKETLSLDFRLPLFFLLLFACFHSTALPLNTHPHTNMTRTASTTSRPSRSRWTPEEEQRLVKAVRVWGEKWTTVKVAMETERSASAIEQHYRIMQKKVAVQQDKKEEQKAEEEDEQKVNGNGTSLYCHLGSLH
jgi:hypothetical protein